MTTSKLTADGVEIAYEVIGLSGPWVTFSHSLGCTRQMWQPQIQALAGRCRVLVYDLPGHGESAVPSARGSLEHLVADVRALMDHLTIEKTHHVGISIGGMIGQTLAIESPERVSRLVLANTAAFLPPPVVRMWEERIALAGEKGLDGIAQASLERWFPQPFRATHPELMDRMAAVFSRTSVQGYVSCSEAIMGLDTRARLNRIHSPVLIIGGTEDPGAPAGALRLMNQSIQGSELVMLQGAGHLSSIDAAQEFNRVLTRFLLESV